MQVPKEMVVERVRALGDADAARRAESELPEKVDPEEHAELLHSLGVDPSELQDDVPRTPGIG
jgi:hypothetical protein